MLAGLFLIVNQLIKCLNRVKLESLMLKYMAWLKNVSHFISKFFLLTESAMMDVFFSVNIFGEIAISAALMVIVICLYVWA